MMTLTIFSSLNLQGGAPCLFTFSPKLSLDVTSVFATFGNIGTYKLRKVDDDYLCYIPGL